MLMNAKLVPIITLSFPCTTFSLKIFATSSACAIAGAKAGSSWLIDAFFRNPLRASLRAAWRRCVSPWNANRAERRRCLYAADAIFSKVLIYFLSELSVGQSEPPQQNDPATIDQEQDANADGSSKSKKKRQRKKKNKSLSGAVPAVRFEGPKSFLYLHRNFSGFLSFLRSYVSGIPM